MQISVQGRPVQLYTGGVPFDVSRPALVFLHGALHDHSGWTLLARWFAHHGHAALAPDLPGHGGSHGPALPDVEALADWVLALLDALALPGAVLVGHSMGSLIALEAAARSPQRVPGLVLIGSTFPMRVAPALLQTAARAPDEAIEMVNRLSIAGWASKPSFPGPGMWLHGSNRALMHRTLRGPHAQGLQAADGSPVNLFAHDFSLCDRYANGLAAAAAVRCPVTMIQGERDQMTPARSSRALAEALRARTVRVDSGHLQMAEAPDAVLQALREAVAAAAAPA